MSHGLPLMGEELLQFLKDGGQKATSQSSEDILTTREVAASSRWASQTCLPVRISAASACHPGPISQTVWVVGHRHRDF